MCQWIEGLITVVVRPKELRALPATRAERKTERANMIPSERNSIQRKQYDNERGCRDGVEIDEGISIEVNDEKLAYFRLMLGVKNSLTDDWSRMTLGLDPI